MGVCDAGTKRPKATREEIEQIRRFCLHGYTCEQTAKRMGCSLRHVEYIRAKHGIHIDDRRGFVTRKWTPEEDSVLRILTEDGCSDMEIAERLGRTGAAVNGRRMRLGISKSLAQTLCWTCQNAVPNLSGRGCEWSRSFQPVPGWKAERVEMRMTDDPLRYETSYIVRACPKYLEDERK